MLLIAIVQYFSPEISLSMSMKKTNEQNELNNYKMAVQM